MIKSVEEQIGINGRLIEELGVVQGSYTHGRNLSFILLILGWVVSAIIFVTGCFLILENYVGISLICLSLVVGLTSALFANIIDAHFDIADNIKSIKEYLVTPDDDISK